MEQIEERERPVWYAPQDFQRITVVNPDIPKRRMRTMIARDMDQGLRHPVDEGLCADEAMIGQHVRAGCHMLPAAESDLEMQRAVLPEQAFRRHRAFQGHSNLRQQLIDQVLLPGAQWLALGTPVETVDRGRVARFVRSHGARA